MAKFEALELGFELGRAAGPLIRQVGKHDRDLAAQLRRAAASIVSCLSEGARREGRDRLHLFRVAAGSNAELRVQLELAVAWGYVDGSAAQHALDLADRVAAISWRLTHPRPYPYPYPQRWPRPGP